MSTHNLTSADNVFVGGGTFGPMQHANSAKGAPINFVSKISLGSPIAADTNALIAAATSTELPNNSTKTYTTANAATSPVDDAGIPTISTVTMADGVAYSVFVLDVPRNITAAATHSSSVVAMTITVTGFDYWGQKVVSQLSIAATGTSQSAAGKKAFKYIYSIAIAASGNATTNTLNMGFGDVLGLPYALQSKTDVLAVFFNDAADGATTFVVADATTATASTGDVRGTIDPYNACDGSAIYIWYRIASRNTETGLRGIDQYAG